MSQNPQQALVELGGLVTGTEKGAQKALVSGKSTFDLPPLSIDFSKETFFHLSAIFSFGPLRGVSSASRNHCGTDAQNVATQDMIMLSIVSGVAQDLIPTSFGCSLMQNRSKLRRILRRPPTDKGSWQQMTASVTGYRKFRPLASVETFVATAPDLVAADVTAFQTRSIDGNLRLFANEFALPSSPKNNNY